jgi:hypothetical protein
MANTVERLNATANGRHIASCVIKKSKNIWTSMKSKLNKHEM